MAMNDEAQMFKEQRDCWREMAVTENKERRRFEAGIERLRAALFKIQCNQLRIASATDMTRLQMREAAMDTRNEIIEVLGSHQQSDRGAN